MHTGLITCTDNCDAATAEPRVACTRALQLIARMIHTLPLVGGSKLYALLMVTAPGALYAAALRWAHPQVAMCEKCGTLNCKCLQLRTSQADTQIETRLSFNKIHVCFKC